MAIDREAILKRAEKLLRQGRLDGAVEEYVHLLEEVPNDWNSRNALGDLYVRAREVDKAAAQFTQIADHFAHEGFLPRAIALYKKVIKIKPDDEHALLQSADINAQQGLLADAKACLTTVVQQRREKGDTRGANEIVVRIATVDPNDLTAQLNGARAAAEMGDATGAAARYKQLAGEFFERERTDDAIAALVQAIELAPSDAEARDSLVTAYLKQGALAEARRFASTAAHFKAIAEDLLGRGQEEDAWDVMAEAIRQDPGDVVTRASLVRRLIARGQTERASAFVAPETLGDDHGLMLLAAEVDLRVGRTDAARAILRTLIERDEPKRSDIVTLGCTLAETDADAGFACVETATESMAAAGDWTSAASALQDFTRVVPLHINALMKLVDVCVDGDLDGPLFAAESQLAEAYIAAGRSFEARVIAEDLVARVPGDPANVDRFRRALVLAGEPDPEAVIADRLSADSALVLEDLNSEPPASDATPGLPVGVDAPKCSEVASEPAFAGYGDGAAPMAAFGARATGRAWTAQPETVSVGGDGRSGAVPEASLPVAAAAPATSGDLQAGGEFDELDLSAALGDMHAGQMSPQTATPDSASPGAWEPGGELDEVFEEFRQEVLREQVSSTAGQHYKLALTYHDMGMTEECMKALEVAARSPRYRFHAAILLARLCRQAGKVHEAIDWFERAAETPAPSADASRALLYELGRALEDEGESVRALAVYLELQAEGGRYRDVDARVKALSS